MGTAPRSPPLSQWLNVLISQGVLYLQCFEIEDLDAPSYSMQCKAASSCCNVSILHFSVSIFHSSLMGQTHSSSYGQKNNVKRHVMWLFMGEIGISQDQQPLSRLGRCLPMRVQWAGRAVQSRQGNPHCVGPVPSGSHSLPDTLLSLERVQDTRTSLASGDESRECVKLQDRSDGERPNTRELQQEEKQ